MLKYNIVIPGNKLKASTKLRLLPTRNSLIIILNSKPAPITNLEATSKCLSASNLALDPEV